MKKLLLFLILLLIPTFVLAEDFEYTIKSKVTIEGKELEGDDFTFDLYDVEGNLIQTKKNDKDGNITFDPITFTAEDATDYPTASSTANLYHDDKYNKYYFYTVKQRKSELEGVTYDEETAYIGVYIFDDGTSRIDYLKDIDRIKEETTEYKVKEGSTVYHATEEDLQGQAYAVFDPSDGSLTFFRDEEGKYTDQQTINGKTYYTDFETGYHPSWQLFEDHEYYTYYKGNKDIKKIVFQDPIKPNRINDGSRRTHSWFANMSNLETIENINLLDTSNITSFDFFFYYDTKIKELDLSTWDTSKVTSTYGMFQGCYDLEEIYTDNFDLSNVIDASYMFNYTESLKWVNQKSFNFPVLRNGDNMFSNSNTIKGLNLSDWNFGIDMGTAGIASTMESLQYANLTNLPGLWSEAIGQNLNLSIVDMGSEYTYVYTNIGPFGAYWYNLNTKKLYDKEDFIKHFTRDKDLEPATYVSPRNNPEPSLFRNIYVEPPKEPERENPETGNYGLYVLLILATISGVVLILQKKKLDFLK